MQLFYSQNINQDIITLDAIESGHATRVLRKKLGDTLNIIDGNGTLYSAIIIDDNHKKCMLRIASKSENYGARGYNLHIALAPTKSIDRYEWFLEKSTEVGCDSFTPLLCSRSERKVVKDERSLKVIISAVKQSIKAFTPQMASLTPFAEFMKQDFGASKKFIAHCEESSEKVLLRDLVCKGESVVVLIGPEGDFSAQEVALAREKGFVEVSLGDCRLRSETAGVFVASLLNIVNQ